MWLASMWLVFMWLVVEKGNSSVDTTAQADLVIGLSRWADRARVQGIAPTEFDRILPIVSASSSVWLSQAQHACGAV